MPDRPTLRHDSMVTHISDMPTEVAFDNPRRHSVFVIADGGLGDIGYLWVEQSI